jgi:hypothetical protein
MSGGKAPAGVIGCGVEMMTFSIRVPPLITSTLAITLYLGNVGYEDLQL